MSKYKSSSGNVVMYMHRESQVHCLWRDVFSPQPHDVRGGLGHTAAVVTFRLSNILPACGNKGLVNKSLLIIKFSRFPSIMYVCTYMYTT